jgi:hypothetical protein
MGKHVVENGENQTKESGVQSHLKVTPLLAKQPWLLFFGQAGLLRQLVQAIDINRQGREHGSIGGGDLLGLGTFAGNGQAQFVSADGYSQRGGHHANEAKDELETAHIELAFDAVGQEFLIDRLVFQHTIGDLFQQSIVRVVPQMLQIVVANALLGQTATLVEATQLEFVPGGQRLALKVGQRPVNGVQDDLDGGFLDLAFQKVGHAGNINAGIAQNFVHQAIHVGFRNASGPERILNQDNRWRVRCCRRRRGWLW